jgi:hypothetical protein
MAKPALAADDVAWMQLSVQVPKTLHRNIKAHCVRTDTKLMAFVIAALEEQLGLAAGPKTETHHPPHAAFIGPTRGGRRRP